MNSASRYKASGSILLMTLMMTAWMTTLAIAGLQRTQYQAQLAAGVARQAMLQAEARRVLAIARKANLGERAQAFTPNCTAQCNWQTAWRIAAANDVSAAYIVQRIAPESGRFVIVARAVHPDGGEALRTALVDTYRNTVHPIR